MIVTAMQPSTTYYVRAVGYLGYNNSVDSDKSNVIRITTKANPAVAISNDHPRLMATRAQLNQLKSRYEAGDARTLFWLNKLKAGVDDALSGSAWSPSSYANGAAILWQITGETKYLNGAKSFLETQLTSYKGRPTNNAYRGAASELAYLTDLLWDQLTPTKRQEILDAMLTTDEVSQNLNPVFGNTDQYIANTQVILSHGLLFLGDNSISANSRTRLEKLFNTGMRRWYGEMQVKMRRINGHYGLGGGGLDDGADYMRGTQHHWVEILQFMENSGFSQSQYGRWVWNNVRSNNIYNSMPDLRHVMTYGDIEAGDLVNRMVPSVHNYQGWSSDSVKLCLMNRYGLTKEASYLRELLLQSRNMSDNRQPDHVWGLLCDSDAIGRSPLSELPTAYFDQGFGLLYDRTNWSSNASYLFFSAGYRTGIDHAHNDAGHISLWADGRWITHEFPEYESSGGALPQSHNILLLGSQGQTAWGYSHGMYGEPVQILHAESSSGHLYALANTTSAYNHLSAVTKVTRSIFWNKSDNRLVVYDRVAGLPAGTSINQQFRDSPAISKLYQQTANGVTEILTVVNGSGTLSSTSTTLGVAGVVMFNRDTGEMIGASGSSSSSSFSSSSPSSISSMSSSSAVSSSSVLVSSSVSNSSISSSSSSSSSSSNSQASLSCATGSGPILYVNGSYNGTETGSLSQPYKSIQSAVTAASAGTLINVATGNYVESVQVTRKVVHLCGGWSSNFSARNSRTFDTAIQGTSANATVVAFTRPGQSSLVGFRIKGGRWGINVDAEGNTRTNNDMLIADNIIENNGSYSSGGYGNGGGIASEGGYITIRGNLIQNNNGGWGAALNIESAEALIETNTIRNNIGGADHGGGVVLWGGKVTFRKNLVKNNEVGRSAGYGWGGGMITLGGPHYFSENVWTENYSPLHGGALFIDEGSVVNMNNDIFYNNRCSREGGDAIAVDGGSGVRSRLNATNITVADHNCPGLSAILMEADSDLVLKNSIVWNPVGTTDIYFQESGSTVNVSYSNYRTVVGAGSYGNVLTEGSGNISGNPMFANSAARDYHLQSIGGRYSPALNFWETDPVHSPAIDAGDPASSYSLESSPNGGRINMGAYGNTPEASRSQ